MQEGRTDYLRDVVALDIGAAGTNSAVCAVVCSLAKSPVSRPGRTGFGTRPSRRPWT